MTSHLRQTIVVTRPVTPDIKRGDLCTVHIPDPNAQKFLAVWDFPGGTLVEFIDAGEIVVVLDKEHGKMSSSSSSYIPFEHSKILTPHARCGWVQSRFLKIIDEK